MVPIGWTPQAVRRRRRTVNKPNRLSSWLKTRRGREFSVGIACWSCLRQVAWNCAIASGFFCVARPRHLEFGLEPGAHDGVERVILDIEVHRLLDPLSEGLIGGKAFLSPQGRLDRSKHGRRDRERLASGHVAIEQGSETARLVERQPTSDGITMDAQQVGHLLAGVGLTTRE